MNLVRRLFPPALALMLVVALVWAVTTGVRLIWGALVGVNPQLAVGVVAAGTTLLASTATVVLGRYYERRKEIDAHFRAEKIKIYDEFLAELFKVFHTSGESSDDMVKFLREWQRKLVLWGGSNVLATYFKWMNHMKASPDARAIFLMDDFFRALRSDIGQSSTGLQRGAFANLILRRGDFFLEQAARNPNLTLADLARLEKERFGDDG